MTSPRVNVRLVVSDHVWREIGELESEIAALETKLIEKRGDRNIHIAIAEAACIPRPEP